MKKNILIYLILFLMFISTACDTKTNTSTEKEDSEINEENIIVKDEKVYLELDKNIIQDNLDELTKTSRVRGTNEEIRAYEYIKEQMDRYGFDTYIQEFDIYKSDVKSFFCGPDFFNLNPYNSEVIALGHNLIADLTHDPSKKTLVFSAHYDTTSNSIGAWDNASGVCSLMEAARLISQEKLDYNLRVIFFSSEEFFLFGSRSYINMLNEKELRDTLGCFNIDMVGNKQSNKLIIESYKGEDNVLTTEFKRIFKNEVEHYPGTNSDEVSFYRKEIPSFRFTTADYLSKDFNPDLLRVETDAVTSVKNNFPFPKSTLTKIWYDEENSNKYVKLYLENGKGIGSGIKPENIIVLLSNFDVDKSATPEETVLTPGEEVTDYQWTLIRDSKTSDWKVDSWGY